MRFVPSREQGDFAASLQDLLAAADTPSIVRAWAGGDHDPGRALWSRLADQGVLALGLAEADGGFGATTVDLVLAFEQLGRAAVPGPYVESVAVLPGLLAGTPDAEHLAGIGAGKVVATVALPPDVPFALDATAADHCYIVLDDRVHRAEPGAALTSVDPARLLSEVAAVGDLGSVNAVNEVHAVNVAAALRSGALATAAQIHGAGQAVLERSTSYARQRSQFGKPIGSFQAVKHPLADVAVALDLARPLLFGAALAVDSGDESAAAREVSAAKVACTDAAYLAARVGLQVHGAIGYTAEHDLSLWLMKIRALVSAWGTQRVHRDRVLEAIRA